MLNKLEGGLVIFPSHGLSCDRESSPAKAMTNPLVLLCFSCINWATGHQWGGHGQVSGFFS